MDENREKKRMRFPLLVRLVSRSADVAARPEMSDEGRWVYNALLAPAGEIFCKSHAAVVDAESKVGETNLQVERMASKLDPVLRTVRTIVLAVLPKQKVPDTLKAQRTLTDMLGALTTVVSIVKSHSDKEWAATILAGQFGTLAPQMEAALKEAIAATHALETARYQRLAAYGPAYSGYLAFKQVVRNTMGPSSWAYRCLHPRKAPSADAEEDEPAEQDEPSEQAEEAEQAAPDSGVLPASKATPAPEGEPSVVKIA